MTINKNSQFWMEVESGKTITVNGNEVPVCYWNLSVLRGQLKMYSVGLKPNRHWKIGDVKKYFGFKGNNDELLGLVEGLIKEFKGQMS
jgi:hypothetical protein